MADPSALRKFTTYTKDTETGAGQLNYATFREHSARIARFHMADPVHGRSSNPQRLNRYAYVSNDPTNRVDPRGLQEGEVCGGGYCIMQDEFNMGYAWSQDELAEYNQYNRGPVVTWDAWSPGGGGFLDPWPPPGVHGPATLGPDPLCAWIPWRPGCGPVGGTPPFVPRDSAFGGDLTVNLLGHCKCFLFLGLARGATGCAYVCVCPNGIDIGFKKCSILDPYAMKECPDYVEFTNGKLTHPAGFCGPVGLPAPR